MSYYFWKIKMRSNLLIVSESELLIKAESVNGKRNFQNYFNNFYSTFSSPQSLKIWLWIKSN